VLPGKLDSKDYANMRSHVDYLAENGYLAISLDPPGTWDSGGDITDYTMTNYIQAVEDVIEYFDNKSTVVIGHSMGGSMAMFAAINNSNVIGFIAIMSPYKFDHLVDRIEGATSKRDLPNNPKEERIYNVPKTFFEDVLKYNAAQGLSKLAKPKLFISGEDDTTITPRTINEIFEISAEPKELISVKSDHDYRNNQAMISEINSIILDWLKRSF
jgi:pimeloyl-ACP methyl ester carboxylesterase